MAAHNKTIIVTGASRGIGLAIARFLISKSANVIVLARSRDPLEKLQNEHPKQVRFITGDMSDFSLGQKAVDFAVEEFGRLDGVIINHGIITPVSRIENSDAKDWSKLFDVNFFSAVAFAKAAIVPLRKTKGCILFTSSGVSTGAYSTWGAYGASKAAMNHLARQIACEEPDITTASVRPGVVDTEMQRDLREVHSAIMSPEDSAKFQGLHQRGELLRPDQPGNVMARMALDPPKELSGSYLNWESEELARFQDS